MTHKHKSSSSLLLIFKQDENHQSLVTDYLINKKIIKNKNQTNLVWFNQDEENLKVEVVRKLISQASYGAYSDKEQICIILHVDKGSQAAQNALLKIVEEPPPNTRIILSASNSHQLLETIKSRCFICCLDDDRKIDPLIETEAELWTKTLRQIDKFSYSNLIDLASKPDREEALSILKHMLNNLDKEGKQQQTDAKMMSKLLEAYHQLNQNFNVKLTLENCFFTIKKNNG